MCLKKCTNAKLLGMLILVCAACFLVYLYQLPILSSRYNQLHAPSAGSKTSQSNSNWKTSRSQVHDHFLQRLTVCIGTQKGGTTSMLSQVLRLKDFISIPTELHYYDRKLHRREHDMDSFDIALQSAHRYNMSTQGYMDLFVRGINKTGNFNVDRAVADVKNRFFEKTPIYLLYPHVAYLMASQFLPYGTKILVFLRNPTTRFISGFYWTERSIKHKDAHWRQKNHMASIDDYVNTIVFNAGINGNNSFVEFRRHLEDLYVKWNEPKHVEIDLLEQVKERYTRFIYFYQQHFGAFQSQVYFIWIRSCYAPQLATWIYHIRALYQSELQKYQHSMKIVQSESVFVQESFVRTMNYLLCYLRFNVGDSYDEYMADCVRIATDREKTSQIRSNQNHYKDSALKLQQRVSGSFDICNKWLEIFMEDKHLSLILDRFEWSHWAVN